MSHTQFCTQVFDSGLFNLEDVSRAQEDLNKWKTSLPCENNGVSLQVQFTCELIGTLVPTLGEIWIAKYEGSLVGSYNQFFIHSPFAQLGSGDIATLYSAGIMLSVRSDEVREGFRGIAVVNTTDRGYQNCRIIVRSVPLPVTLREE